MIDSVNIWLPLSFLAIVISTVLLFYYSNQRPKKVLLAIILYAIVQSILAYLGFYQETYTFPPRLALVFIPTVVFLIMGIKNMDWVMKNRNTKVSTYLHSIRIFVELVLFQLYLVKMLPVELTFEGRNFDIIIGLSAVLVGVLYMNGRLSKKVLIGWNIVGLCMVLFIFFNAVFAVDSPIQLLGFDQPNRAVLLFPYILLPVIVVPIVIYTHITDVLKLRNELYHSNLNS